MVVDRDMEEVVAVATPTNLFAASMQPPAAALGYSSELLHIDMEQVAGSGVLVAAVGVLAAHRGAGDRIDRAQRQDLVAAQDPSNGRGHQPEPAGQEHRAPTSGGPQGQDPCFDLGRDPGRAAVWAGGTVE
jgi:hypothetical protein